MKLKHISEKEWLWTEFLIWNYEGLAEYGYTLAYWAYGCYYPARLVRYDGNKSLYGFRLKQ